MKTSLKLYSAAQKLYPAPFRAAYSKEQIQTLADMLEHTTSGSGKYSVLARVWADLAVSVLIEQINYQGTALMNETPKFLKVTSLISALMLVPFLIALSVNTLDRLIYHHNLYSSWLWHFPFLGLWVLWLPQAALLLALIGYLVYLVHGQKGNWLNRITDLRHSWMIIVPGVLAFGILFILAFHDSIQCLGPAHLFGHASSSVQCFMNNNALPAFRKFF